MAAAIVHSAAPCRLGRPARAAGGCRRLGVAHARRGSQRRWWQEPWGEDGGTEGWGPDGPLPPSSSGGALPSAEQVITFFCCDGSMVQLGARPSPLQQAERRSSRRHSAADSMPLPEEQGLCIGSVFTIRATNGHDVKRKLDLRGFCFSTERLFERVEDTVLARGGEVFETERLLKSGVHEALVMTVAIPLLWGVPPEYEHLKAGIKTGGGIIDNISRHWYIY